MSGLAKKAKSGSDVNSSLLKEYRSPVLTHFGSVASMTQSGSAGPSESSSSPNPMCELIRMVMFGACGF